MKQKQFQKQHQEKRAGTSFLLKVFALLAFMLCGVNGAWGQDAVFDMGKMTVELTSADGKEKLTFAGGGPEDVHESAGVTDLSENASMTLSGVNLRYIRITFANNETTYNLKWGGNSNANNSVSAKESIILVSNYGADDIKIVNDTEKGTTNTPIKKVEVFYHQQGFDNATANHTEANATEEVVGFTCQNNTIPLDKINIVGQYCSFSSTNGRGIMMNTSGNHYLSIKFESAVDLHELSSLILDGDNLDAVVNRVEFVCEGGEFSKYQHPTNINSLESNQSDLAKKVKELRIHNDSKEGSFTIKSITINLGGQHVKVTPTLDTSTTQAEMVITEGDPLTLKITNDAGFWREYTNADHTQVVDTRLKTNAWRPIAYFDGANGDDHYAKLSEGHYYFGIYDSYPCDAFHVQHSSPELSVHVKVNSSTSVTLNGPAEQTIALGETLSLGVTVAGNPKFTQVELYSDPELTNKIGFVGYNNPYTFNPSEGVKKGDAPNQGTVLKQGAGVYYLAFSACKPGDGYNFTTKEVYKISVVDRNATVSADFTDRGHGSGVSVNTDGVLTTTAGYDNWANIFVFPSSTNAQKNVEVSADNYAGLTLTANGDESRIIIYYNAENGDNKQIVIPASSSNVEHTYFWSDFGLSNTEVKNIRRIAVAGRTAGQTTRYSNTKLVNIPQGAPVGYTAIHVTHDGQTKEREFIVHVPSGASGAVPVLFSLHDKDGDYNSRVANYDALSNNEKFIVVYPRGLNDRFAESGGNHRGWLSTGQYNEDVKFFEEVIEWLNKNYLIDSEHVYMTGFSNGATMTYSTAFTSDRFAGFAAVSGYPLDEFHLQHYGNGSWQGSHPVPFMHIHGTNDEVVSKSNLQPIIDNMVYRNGCKFVPATATYEACEASDDKPAALKATKEEFGSTTGTPFVVYTVEGMGHTADCHINVSGGANWDNASQTIIWNFLKDKKRINMSDYNNRNRNEFLPRIEDAPDYHVDHGWKRDLEHNILWQYGETQGECNHSGNTNSNVYHTIQLGPGYHNVKFKSSSSMGNTSTMWVTVRMEQIATLDADGNRSIVTPTNVVVCNRDYNIGEVSFNIEGPKSGIAEYRLTFEWHNSDTSDRGKAAGKDIQISGVSILNNTGVDMGVFHSETIKQDFGGYFDFENRLIAQWNFDLCDGARFHRPSLGSKWVADNASLKNGVITYTYNGVLNNEQLTYDNAPDYTLIPIAAGLKFKTNQPGQVKIQAYVEDGNLVRTQLVLEKDVEMYIPYVHNSYRNDKGNNGSTYNQFDEYMDCLHHINRDILYVSSSPDFFQAIKNEHYYNGTYQNDSQNGQKDFLFISGGAGEVVKGAKVSLPQWEKLNYCGKQGDDCWVTITQQVTIDRLAVNRNLITSFYTENISLDTEQSRPYPGMRYVGSPAGSKVADVGATYASYANAIAMTFGGWDYNYNEFKNGSGSDVKDSWGELNVFHGDGLGEGNQNYNIDDDLDVTKVPLATDGFPVYSRNINRAYSETVNPTAESWEFDKNKTGSNLSYHDANLGDFYLSKEDGGTYEYVENVTPWSLPCRGAYIKFEPTYPGVLNVHILQEANKVYYIADEFGKLVKEVFAKTGTEQIVSGTPTNGGVAGHFKVAQKDNVKYVFNVYPGKSYYLFSNEAEGLGFTGFYFEPYVYAKKEAGKLKELERDDIGIKTAELNAESGYTGPSSLTWNDQIQNYSNQTAAIKDDAPVGEQTTPKTSAADYVTKYSGETYYQPISYDNRAVRVRYERHFAKNTWSTICLPYSLNHLQLETIFGKDVKVILMRDVQEIGKNSYNLTTANFIYHKNQDIIAGYPYLIYPSEEIWSVTANVMIPDNTPSLVSVNGKGQNTVTHPGAADYKITQAYNYDGLACYDFTGNFVPELLPKGSYVVATNGKLTRLPNAQTAAPFRAFLKYNVANDSDEFKAKERKIEAVNYGILDEETEATDIDDVLLMSGIVGAKTNVYNMNGMIVRENTDDLNGLPKGLYIVNGKKYMVK